MVDYEQRIIALEKRVTALEQQITLLTEGISAKETADIVSERLKSFDHGRADNSSHKERTGKTVVKKIISEAMREKDGIILTYSHPKYKQDFINLLFCYLERLTQSEVAETVEGVTAITGLFELVKKLKIKGLPERF